MLKFHKFVYLIVALYISNDGMVLGVIFYHIFALILKLDQFKICPSVFMKWTALHLSRNLDVAEKKPEAIIRVQVNISRLKGH